MGIVVDRRAESGKHLKSRERFLERTRDAARKAINGDLNAKSIKDFGTGGVDVTVPKRGLVQPTFQNGKGGVKHGVLPGNDNESFRHRAGDRLPRPPGGGGGSGSEGSPDGEGEDDFRYHMSEAEKIQLILEDLELPNMDKMGVKDTQNTTLEHAGYSHTGTFNRLSLIKSKFEKSKREIFMNKRTNEKILNLLDEQKVILSAHDDRDSLEASNVVMLNAPSAKARIKALSAEVSELKINCFDRLIPAESDRIAEIDTELAGLYAKQRRVAKWREHDDLRFRAVEEEPTPTSQAVMFCDMDVSGSMTEHMKSLAKTFYALLYRFLKQEYDHVEVVFIRHTHKADEVDEDTFFNSPETGGTVVSTGLEEILKVQQQRYEVDKWNMYTAQASDGDNTASDNDKTKSLMVKKILPIMQGVFYIEVGRDAEHFPPGFIRRDSDLWQTYEPLTRQHSDRFWAKKVGAQKDIVPMFRDLFKKRPKGNSATLNAAAFGF